RHGGEGVIVISVVLAVLVWGTDWLSCRVVCGQVRERLNMLGSHSALAGTMAWSSLALSRRRWCCVSQLSSITVLLLLRRCVYFSHCSQRTGHVKSFLQLSLFPCRQQSVLSEEGGGSSSSTTTSNLSITISQDAKESDGSVLPTVPVSNASTPSNSSSSEPT